ncbi:MAG: polyprenyl synthetase family protein [Candidatus Hydrogenedentes bacterium]|nr:polyprenyl synthetase family protein [Candidatus Hydrogenedentota bacterium]
MSVHEFLAGKAAKCERALRAYLDSWADVPPTLREAIEYSLFAGGKRFRPALALGAADIVSGDDAVALPVACALEMIHTYSLIHDDLPAMDDDDLRRGKPTSHRVYGEAIAILAGDGLLTMAFDMAAQCNVPAVIRELAQAAGVAGMVGGQVIDLESEHRTLALDELRRLHAAKTGALIRVSVRAGALLAGAAPEPLDALTRFGEHIGLAFQIADDILDVVGAEEVLGKPVGSDAANDKSTYPALVGLDRARELAAEAVAAAVDALAPFGPEADTFRALARFIVERDK